MKIHVQGDPPYPKLSATVEKWRRKAANGLSTLTREERREYGATVEKAILALQRSELSRETPTHSIRCASGTLHTDGADIHRAIQQRQRNSLLACPGQERRARSRHDWRVLYEAAMAEKREREEKANRRPLAFWADPPVLECRA
jgi:hypothetical protein